MFLAAATPYTDGGRERLPQVSADVTQGPAMHIFALGVGAADEQTAMVCDTLGNPDVPTGITVREEGDGHTTATTAGGQPASA